MTGHSDFQVRGKKVNNMLHVKKFKTIAIICACIVVMAGIIIVFAGKNFVPAIEEAKVSNGIQNVTTDLVSKYYPNISVQKDVPLIWNFRADPNVLNSCNSTLIISEYSIRVNLKGGENIITFTPEGEGTIQYSCSMGMVTGQITVVDDLGLLAPAR